MKQTDLDFSSSSAEASVRIFTEFICERYDLNTIFLAIHKYPKSETKTDRGGYSLIIGLNSKKVVQHCDFYLKSICWSFCFGPTSESNKKKENGERW